MERYKETEKHEKGTTYVLDCGHEWTFDGMFGPCIWTETGETTCKPCTAARQLKDMAESGKAILYLTIEAIPSVIARPAYAGYIGTAKVTNFDGGIDIRGGLVERSRHNLAGVRYDFWFRGPDENGEMCAVWHGYTVGDMTQIAHCKRTRKRYNDFDA